MEGTGHRRRGLGATRERGGESPGAAPCSDVPRLSWATRRARAEGPDAQHLRGRGRRCVAAVPGGGAGPGGGRLDPHGAGGLGHSDGEKPFTAPSLSPLFSSPRERLGQDTGDKARKRETVRKKHMECKGGADTVSAHGAQTRSVGQAHTCPQGGHWPSGDPRPLSGNMALAARETVPGPTDHPSHPLAL